MNDKERVDEAVRRLCNDAKLHDCIFIDGTGEFLKSFLDEGTTIAELPLAVKLNRMKFERDTYCELFMRARELLFNKERDEETISNFFFECHAAQYWIDNDSMSIKAQQWLLEELTKEE